MSNLTSLLREEIIRLAKRQINAEIGPLKKRLAQQRKTIAALKEDCGALRREISALSRREHAAAGNAAAAAAAAAAGSGQASAKRRFRADGFRSFRSRLGLSVRDIAALLGVSEQTIYNWETAATRPQPAMVDQIAEVRALGKRELRARLDQLQS